MNVRWRANPREEEEEGLEKTKVKKNNNTDKAMKITLKKKNTKPKKTRKEIRIITLRWRRGNPRNKDEMKINTKNDNNMMKKNPSKQQREEKKNNNITEINEGETLKNKKQKKRIKITFMDKTKKETLENKREKKIIKIILMKLRWRRNPRKQEREEKNNNNEIKMKKKS